MKISSRTTSWRWSAQRWLALGLLGLLWGCSRHSGEPGEQAEKHDEPRVQHGTNGEVVITLSASSQKAIGLQTMDIQRAELPPEAKVYGRVLDPGPLSALVAEFVIAQAAAATSEAELKRLQGLAAGNNASERAVQTAQSAATRDQAQLESVRLRILGNWGEDIAGLQDLPNFVRRLTSLEASLIQLNLPVGEALSSLPNGARVFDLAEESKPLQARFLGLATATDPTLQNKGFLFAVEPNSAKLSPGQSITGFLTLPGLPRTGVAVPHAAMVQFQGLNWVYLQTGEETFRRVAMKPGIPLNDAEFVREGFHPGDRVVTTGAQELLSEELKSQLEE
jgi:membrane fusion protein, multidrug efflux system